MAKFLSTQGPHLESSFFVNGKTYWAMDCFSEYSVLKVGQEAEIEFSTGLLRDNESWESIFSTNPEKRESLERIEGWSYRVLGKISKINPVRVEVEGFELEAPVATQDSRVIGEYIAFTIERLDVCVLT